MLKIGNSLQLQMSSFVSFDFVTFSLLINHTVYIPFFFLSRFFRIWAGSTEFPPRTLAVQPDARAEGGEKMDGRMLDRGQVEMEGVGRSPPPRDVCGSQAKEMLQPRREGIALPESL